MEMGYITAAGTPHDSDGCFIASSFSEHLANQVKQGAAGLLVMGSMGLGLFVRHSDYAKVARTAVETVRGQIPVYVGVSDCSAGRCKERIDMLEGLAVDGVVATVPYYYPASPEEHFSFFKMLADYAKAPVYLYDLPTVSKSGISLSTVQALSKHPNIKGIKTPNLALAAGIVTLREEGVIKAGFAVFFSGLDVFDTGARLGIRLFLDGMPACTPALTRTAIDCFKAKDYAGGRAAMSKIIELRDIFVGEKVFTGFSYAMNLLGFAGNFAPDFQGEASEAQKGMIHAKMTELGLV